MKMPFEGWVERSEIKMLRRVLTTAVFIFIWSMTTHNKISGDGDEPHYMMIAQSLAFDRDLDMTNNYSDRKNIIFDGNLGLDVAHVTRGRGGRLYPSHDIGMPLLFAPYFYVVYRLSGVIADRIPQKLLKMAKLNRWGLLKEFMGLAMIFLTGLLSALVFDLCHALTGSKAGAFYWAFFTAVTPPILSHAYLFFTEILTALIAVYSYKIYKIEKDLKNRHLAVAGFLTGYLFLVHVRNIGIAAVLLGFFLVRILVDEDREDGRVGSNNLLRKLSYFLVPFFAVILFRTWLNYYLWERWISTEHAGLRMAMDIKDALKESILRIFALCFDQEGGLFSFAPLYLLSLCGFMVLWKRDKRTFFELSVMFLFSYFLIVSYPLWNVQGWAGFWSPAGRYLVSVIPFLSIGSFYFFCGRTSVPRIVKLLIWIQIGLDLFFWQFPKLLWNAGTGASSFLLFCGRGSRTLVNLFPSWGWNNFSIHALFLSSGLALIWISGSILLNYAAQFSESDPH